MEFLMQPINRTPLEEGNDNNSMMEAVRVPVVAAAEVELPAPAPCSADGQICIEPAGAEPAGVDRAECSENSIEQVDPKTTGWTQRVRVGAAALGRAPCPDRVTALEKTVRQFAEEPGDIVILPKIGTSFDTLGEAYDFYNLYSWEKGFGIRYGKSRLNVKRTKCMQEIVCGCAGKPIVENTRSCRCECPALIRLLRSKDHGWYIAEHREVHNHALSQTYGQTLHWPSQKHIDVYSRDLVKQLWQNNVNLAKVYSIIGSFFGKMENVPFTKRALRNLCGKISREQSEDDVRKTMQVFQDLCSKDPQFTYRVQAENEGGEPVEKSPVGKGSGRSSKLPGPPASMEFLMQPINRTLLEEVNENNNTMEPLHYPVMAPAEVELPAPAASSADGQICVDAAAPEPASADKAQGSEHSIEQVDPKTPGWTQRVRVGAAALGRAPCPDRITALEKSVRRFAEESEDIVIVPKIGTSFDTLGEAYDFYNLYLWEKGFGIRYGNSRLNVNRTKCMQEIVCGCAV